MQKMSLILLVWALALAGCDDQTSNKKKRGDLGQADVLQASETVKVELFGPSVVEEYNADG